MVEFGVPTRSKNGFQIRLAELEHAKATLLEAYTHKASRGLDYFTPEDRHQAYKKLRLSALVHPGGDLDVNGTLRKLAQNCGTSKIRIGMVIQAGGSR